MTGVPLNIFHVPQVGNHCTIQSVTLSSLPTFTFYIWTKLHWSPVTDVCLLSEDNLLKEVYIVLKKAKFCHDWILQFIYYISAIVDFELCHYNVAKFMSNIVFMKQCCFYSIASKRPEIEHFK